LSPGGTDGVDERDTLSKSLRRSAGVKSAALSATRASTDIEASSSDGRTLSSVR
jgi:hypothetical protein